MKIPALEERIPRRHATARMSGNDALTVSPVRSRRDWKAFHHVPHRVYSGDPNWVAPLLAERKLHFSQAHNPFFQHAKAEFWIATKGDTPVGRISAQIDQLHLAHHHDATGHFGFIEGVDDPDVFRSLLGAAEAWLRNNGVNRARGPVSFSMWDQPGLLIEGFDTPPSVLMSHARPYYAAHIEAAGYEPVQNLLAYSYDTALQMPPAMMQVLDRAKKQGHVVVRPLRKHRRHIDAEVELILDILNDAWSGNWGFVPMTRAEIADIATILKVLLRPDDVAIAEYRGKAEAFAIVFPNVNEAIHDLSGRIFPLGWARLLWRLFARTPRTARMPLMGVRKAMQTSSLGAALAIAAIDATRFAVRNRGVEEVEFSWILEQNHRVRHIIERGGGKISKRYRIYDRSIGI